MNARNETVVEMTLYTSLLNHRTSQSHDIIIHSEFSFHNLKLTIFKQNTCSCLMRLSSPRYIWTYIKRICRSWCCNIGFSKTTCLSPITQYITQSFITSHFNVQSTKHDDKLIFSLQIKPFRLNLLRHYQKWLICSYIWCFSRLTTFSP